MVLQIWEACKRPAWTWDFLANPAYTYALIRSNIKGAIHVISRNSQFKKLLTIHSSQFNKIIIYTDKSYPMENKNFNALNKARVI